MSKKIECSMSNCVFYDDDEYCTLATIATDADGNCITYEIEEYMDTINTHYGAQSAQNVLDALHEFDCESVLNCSDCVYNANNGCLKEILLDIINLTGV